MRSSDIEIPLIFMGEDFVAYVKYDVKSYGMPMVAPSFSHPGDPPEPPEWEYTSVSLLRDFGGGRFGAEFVTTGALFYCLCENDEISEKISEAICEMVPDCDAWDY